MLPQEQDSPTTRQEKENLKIIEARRSEELKKLAVETVPTKEAIQKCCRSLNAKDLPELTKLKNLHDCNRSDLREYYIPALHEGLNHVKKDEKAAEKQLKTAGYLLAIVIRAILFPLFMKEGSEQKEFVVRKKPLIAAIEEYKLIWLEGLDATKKANAEKAWEHMEKLIPTTLVKLEASEGPEKKSVSLKVVTLDKLHQLKNEYILVNSSKRVSWLEEKNIGLHNADSAQPTTAQTLLEIHRPAPLNLGSTTSPESRVRSNSGVSYMSPFHASHSGSTATLSPSSAATAEAPAAESVPAAGAAGNSAVGNPSAPQAETPQEAPRSWWRCCR